MPRVQSTGSQRNSSAPTIRPVETPERSARVRSKSSPVPDSVEATFTHDQIAERAYELFLARGSEDGHDLEDWLEAERLVKSAASSRGNDTIQ